MKHGKEPHKIPTCPRDNNYQFIWYCCLWIGKKNPKNAKNTTSTEKKKKFIHINYQRLADGHFMVEYLMLSLFILKSSQSLLHCYF